MQRSAPSARGSERSTVRDRAPLTPSRLSVELENLLTRRWHERHDIAAADRLTAAHLDLLTSIAGIYRGRGLSAEDLVGEGHVGLMHAVCRFDPRRAARFASYATPWIHAAIQGALQRRRSPVKVVATGSHAGPYFLPHAPKPYPQEASRG